MTVIVSGAAGFIGSNFIINWLSEKNEKIIGLDKLTYAGNLENLKSAKNNANFQFFKGDIGDSKLVTSLLINHQPRTVINFAAESHVDRSILGPDDFMQTNIMGTYRLLQEVRSYFDRLPKLAQKDFRFLHVSTDEVYGTLKPNDPAFKENKQYEPNSPYSASKAASDHLVRAWYQTYGLPVVTTNCSNNYGPYQFPEKLIPLCILKAIRGENLPIYGDGQQVRDWLFVVDHCKAIITTLEKGKIGEAYNIGGKNEKTNLEVVHILCDLLDELRPKDNCKSYREQITFVKDRPGHDHRYAVDATKIINELGWKPKETFETGIRKTVQWYLDNQAWVDHVQSGDYQLANAKPWL
jgi:dTDP-glucose 4,6-dehydratase